MHPAHAHAGVLGMAGCSGEGHTRDLQRRDVPPAPSEPDRVRTLAAADVQDSLWGQIPDLGHERSVRVPAPHLVQVGVAAVPLRLHGCVADERTEGR